MNLDERIFRLFLRVVRPLRNKGLGSNRSVVFTYRGIEKFLMPKARRMVTLPDYQLHLVLSSIDGISQNLIYNGEYEPVATSVLRKYTRLEMNVIDVGANIGYFTLLLSKLVGNLGKVFAFEPEKQNYAALCHNIQLNNGSNILTYQNAVGNVDEMCTLYVSSEESGEHSLVTKRHCHATQTVKVVRLDDLVRNADVIKTDTEGNDFHVLQGAERLLSAQPLLITEFWPDGIIKSGHTCEEFWSLLHFYYKDILIADEVEKTLTTGTIEDAIRRIGVNMMSVNLICSKESLL